MNAIFEFCEMIIFHPWFMAVGWTLVHFVWQAALVALVMAGLLLGLRRGASQTRYVCGVMGLAAMAALPLITGLNLILNLPPQPDEVSKTISDGNSVAVFDQSRSSSFDANRPAGQSAQSLELADGLSLLSPTMDNQLLAVSPLAKTEEIKTGLLYWENIANQTRVAIPWLVLFWFVGVLMRATRLLGGLHRVHVWRTSATPLVDPRIQGMLERLSARITPRCLPLILVSRQVAAPAVVGFLKPAILVPASMLSGLTTSELEPILAHELAHIRRYDWLVNLLQSMIETLGFFHPAVWWLSQQVRVEREHCCDDFAVEICGNPVQYARALSKIEAFRSQESDLLIAATGGNLLARIQRIVVGPPTTKATGWPAGFLTFLLFGILAVSIGVTSDHSNVLGASDNQEKSPFNLKQERLIPGSEPAFPAEIDIVIAPDDSNSMRKSESVFTDGRTGRPARVFSGIQLFTGTGAEERKASLSMKYSNVFSYSLIPESVAKQLQAVTLGEIDFGEQPPSPPQSVWIDSDVVAGDQPQQTVERPTTPTPRTDFFVHEVSQPLESGQRIVPYAEDAVWVPGHLGFYDMNQKQQHKFRVVRIDKVALGIGKSFGPINALVLDDENSEFGLVGSDWTQQVRGPAGEVLWFSAADAAWFLHPPAGQEKEAIPPPAKAVQDGGLMSVESSGEKQQDSRQDQPGVELIKSHTYDASRRESSKFVTVNNQSHPVDVGVAYQGVWVGLTLMQDIVAIEESSGRVLWFVAWQKSHPFWKTLSIVEVSDSNGQKRRALEAFAVDSNTGEGTYRYRDLWFGNKLESVSRSTGAPIFSDWIPLEILESVGGVTRVAAINHNQDVVDPMVRLNRIYANQKMTDALGNKVEGKGVHEWTEQIVFAEPGRSIGNAVDAERLWFTLPPASDLRAEFRGESVEIQKTEQGLRIVLTHGRLELKDEAGVIRAWASPDGGAEQLIAAYSENKGKRHLELTARRLVPTPDDPFLPVQCVVTPDPELQPKEELLHGTHRFRLVPMTPESRAFRFEQVHYFDPTQLQDQVKSVPDPNDTTGWGGLADSTGIRSRLTLQTENPQVGEPLRFKLEVKNFGDRPTKIDPQMYAPFRVLRVKFVDDRRDRLPFIGFRPQTFGQQVELAPGASHLLWENIDLNDLFLLAEAGEYEVMAEGGEWAMQNVWRDSNLVPLKLTGGEPTDKQQLLVELLGQLRPDWELSQAFGDVFFSHSPTNLKSDVTSIQLLFRAADEADALQAKWPNANNTSIVRLGPTRWGEGLLVKPAAADRLWPECVEEIQQILKKFPPQNPADAPLSPTTVDRDQLPWTVAGRISDANDQPIEGASVMAHCGMGTLLRTGTATSDENGRYRLDFGSAIHSNDLDMIQAATISVSYPGYFETNLGRQGDLIAAWKQPATLEWGDRNEEHLVLPGKTKVVNFRLAPATRLVGRIVQGENQAPAAGFRVELTGDVLPPSSSVFDVVEADGNGQFEFPNVPTGYSFQVLIFRPGHENEAAFASPPLAFRGNTSTEDTEADPTATDHTAVAFRDGARDIRCEFKSIQFILNGSGESWRNAISSARDQPLRFNETVSIEGNLFRSDEVTAVLGKRD